MKRYRVKRGVTAKEAPSKEEASRLTSSFKKNRVHISQVKVEELRIMMDEAAISHAFMTNAEVRIECIRRYGCWYVVANETS